MQTINYFLVDTLVGRTFGDMGFFFFFSPGGNKGIQLGTRP